MRKLYIAMMIFGLMILGSNITFATSFTITTGTTESAFGNLNYGAFWAQKFTMWTNFSIEKVAVYMDANTNSPTQPLNISILNNTAGQLPDKAGQYAVGKNVSGVTQTAWNWVTINSGTIPNGTYWIQVNSLDTGANVYNIGRDYTGTYTNGTDALSNDQGGTYTLHPNNAAETLMMVIYINTVTPPLVAPNVTIYSPVNITALDYQRFYNFSAISVVNTSLTCQRILDGVSTSLGTISNNTFTTGFINTTSAFHNLTFVCGDQNGNTSASVYFTTLHWQILSQGYNTTANETTTQSFNLTIQTVGIISSISDAFNYSGTSYTGTVTAVNATLFYFNLSLPIGLVDANNTQNSYNWTYILQYTNGTTSTQRTTTNTQAILWAYYPDFIMASANNVTELASVSFASVIRDYLGLATLAVNTTFNNAVYPASLAVTSGTTKNYTVGITMPLAVNAVDNLLWNSTLYVTFNGITKARLSGTSTEIINQVGLKSSCAAGDIRILNFTYVDEETNLPLSGVNVTSDGNKFNANFLIYLNNKADLNGRNISYNMTGSNSYVICMQGSSNMFHVDADINYFNTTYYSSSRWYYFRNLSVSNVTQYYNLYLIPTSVATEVPILLKSADGISIASNYIVVALRQLIAANNTFVPVGMTLTSSSSTQNGDLFLHTGNAVYQFNMYDSNGVLINVVPQTVIASPQIGTVLATPLSLTLGSATLSSVIGSILATSKNCGLSGTTFICNYNDTTQQIRTAWLTVVKVGAATYTQVCRVSNTSYAGMLSCDISSGGNGSYYYQMGGYFPLKSSIAGGVYWNVLDDGSFFVGGTSPYGTEGLMFAVLLIIMFAMIGSFNPVVTIFMGIAAMGLSVALGMVTLSQSTLIGIVAIGIIIAIKVRG